MRWPVWYYLVGMLLPGLASCGSSGPPPRPRTAQEINEERKQLPALYLTAKSHLKRKAPANALPFANLETREIFWPAYCCLNPNCPGQDQGSDGYPYLFVHDDPLMEVDANGEIHPVALPQGTDVYAEMLKRGGYSEATCPECVKQRKLATETKAEKLRYTMWVQPYVLPETEKRLQELDAEQAKWDEYVRAHKNLPLRKFAETE